MNLTLILCEECYDHNAEEDEGTLTLCTECAPQLTKAQRKALKRGIVASVEIFAQQTPDSLSTN